MTGEMRAAQGVPDPMTQTIANSRRFRALPVYAALLDQGRAGYVALVRRNVLFARRVAAWMGSGAGRGYYEVMNLRGGTTPLNMVLFRAARTNPVAAYREERGRLERAINGTGEMQVTGGAGGSVRMGVSNWQTGEDDFGIVVRVLVSIVEEHLI
jgi:glutamate/tyrosine decarboxylase-like PLP-dependent enzyme